MLRKRVEGRHVGLDFYDLLIEAPKIHGELLKLGFHISERTVGRYLRRLHPRQRDHSQNGSVANEVRLI
jgi:hypothetical protein